VALAGLSGGDQWPLGRWFFMMASVKMSLATLTVDAKSEGIWS